MKPKCSVTNKSIFSDLGEAKSAILSLKGQYWDFVTHKRRKRRCKKVNQKRAYYCEHCKGYHLTSQEAYTEKTKLTYERPIKKYRRIPSSVWSR